MKKIRDHDKLYLNSNRYNKPKESFKLLGKILKKNLSKNKSYSILDIGCANGELLFYLDKNFDNLELHGVDVRQDLIDLAKNKLNKVINLKRLDYNKKTLNKKFDIVICSGVLSIFDNLDVVMKNIKKNLKKNSSIYLFNSFNEYDYDVIISYKDINSNIEEYQSGWNIWSLKTISKYFKGKKITKYPFNIKLDVKKNSNDLIRSWTTKIENKRYFTNGLSMIQKQMWLKIK
jgi:ubiquinone/menaquinone biosynthesis C-methylase UbiE